MFKEGGRKLWAPRPANACNRFLTHRMLRGWPAIKQPASMSSDKAYCTFSASEKMPSKSTVDIIALAGIRQHHHDPLALCSWLLCYTCRSGHGCTAGNTRQNTFLRHQLVSPLNGFIIRNRVNLVHHIQIQVLGQEASTNTLNSWVRGDTGIRQYAPMLPGAIHLSRFQRR